MLDDHNSALTAKKSSTVRRCRFVIRAADFTREGQAGGTHGVKSFVRACERWREKEKVRKRELYLKIICLSVVFPSEEASFHCSADSGATRLAMRIFASDHFGSHRSRLSALPPRLSQWPSVRCRYINLFSTSNPHEVSSALKSVMTCWGGRFSVILEWLLTFGNEQQRSGYWWTEIH